MRFGKDICRRGLLVGAAALGAGLAPAVSALAGLPVEEAVFRLRDFRTARARPVGGRLGAPVLLLLPVVSGPCAPIHLGFARRLAAAGYHVMTPELPERRAAEERAGDIAETFALAAREGASRSRLGVVGYDGGARAARQALEADARILAGVVYPGPLTANPVSRPGPGAASKPDARLLEHPGCADLPAAAAAALGGGLAWMAARGVVWLS